jgi:hypothetical protein
MPCLTYTDADVDLGSQDNLDAYVPTVADAGAAAAATRTTRRKLGVSAECRGAEAAVVDEEGVRYTPDFESESEEEEESSEESDGESTTSGEYVYSRVSNRICLESKPFCKTNTWQYGKSRLRRQWYCI